MLRERDEIILHGPSRTSLNRLISVFANFFGGGGTSTNIICEVEVCNTMQNKSRKEEKVERMK